MNLYLLSFDKLNVDRNHRSKVLNTTYKGTYVTVDK